MGGLDQRDVPSCSTAMNGTPKIQVYPIQVQKLSKTFNRSILSFWMPRPVVNPRHRVPRDMPYMTYISQLEHDNRSRDRRPGRRRRPRVPRTGPTSRLTKELLRHRGRPKDLRGSRRLRHSDRRPGSPPNPRVSSTCRRGGRVCLRRIGARLFN